MTTPRPTGRQNKSIKPKTSVEPVQAEVMVIEITLDVERLKVFQGLLQPVQVFDFYARTPS